MGMAAELCCLGISAMNSYSKISLVCFGVSEAREAISGDAWLVDTSHGLRSDHPYI
jgi:hypothetical protein